MCGLREIPWNAYVQAEPIAMWVAKKIKIWCTSTDHIRCHLNSYSVIRIMNQLNCSVSTKYSSQDRDDSQDSSWNIYPLTIAQGRTGAARSVFLCGFVFEAPRPLPGYEYHFKPIHSFYCIVNIIYSAFIQLKSSSHCTIHRALHHAYTSDLWHPDATNDFFGISKDIPNLKTVYARDDDDAQSHKSHVRGVKKG